MKSTKSPPSARGKKTVKSTRSPSSRGHTKPPSAKVRQRGTPAHRGVNSPELAQNHHQEEDKWVQNRSPCGESQPGKRQMGTEPKSLRRIVPTKRKSRSQSPPASRSPLGTAAELRRVQERGKSGKGTRAIFGPQQLEPEFRV